MTRLAYLVSHPIQYQAPLLRRIAAEPDIDLHVLFMSDFSVRAYKDEGFGVQVQWDVPLLDGYSHEFLPQRGAPATNPAEIRNSGIGKALAKGRFDVLWSHGYRMRTSLEALLIARTRGLPTLVRSENQRTGVLRGRFGGLKDRAVGGILRLPTAFLTIGTLNADYYRELGVADARMFSVPYAIDNDRFRRQAQEATPEREALRAELGLQPGRPVILFASKFQRRKRAIDLLRAHQTLLARGAGRRPYLLFIGDGEARPELEAAVDDPESVRLLGFKNQTELPRFFDLCDVFVLPSDSEQWGLVVNEAMCASRAVIVTDEVGCYPDLVHPGENGHVVPVGDIEALGRALEFTLVDPSRAAAMGERSWEIVREWGFDADLRGLRRAIASVRG